jgi:hypothetical protein
MVQYLGSTRMVACKGAGRLLMMAMALVSCSGSSSDSSGNDCSPPCGLYSYAFTNGQTNDPAECPLPQDFSQVLPSTNPTPYGCGISASTTSQTACSASVETQCNVTTFDGYTGVRAAIGTVDSNRDGSVLTGSIHAKLVYAAGQGQCGASWDFTATRVHQ